jgi:RNA polymerase-binding transcription factor DksA
VTLADHTLADHTLADHTDEAARLGQAGAELDAVEAALQRLDDGSFDRCEVCRAPISIEQLSADPLRTRCAQHSPPV